MKTVSISLSHKSIEKAIAELEQYKEQLQSVLYNIVYSLAKIGITAAEKNTGQYAGYISFETTVEKNDIGYLGMLIAKDKQNIVRSWWKDGHIVGEDVSPLLMAEFGSGWFANVANVWSSLNGQVGQGTFPGQEHAFDPDGWHWTDLNGQYHKSYGEHPTMPVLSAWMAMKTAVDETARKEFEFYFS